ELRESRSAGERLAAVATLEALPDPAYLPWLAGRIGDERPFIEYHAAVALLSAARSLPDDDLGALDEALSTAVRGASGLAPDEDRAVTLSYARDELQRRLAGAGSGP